MNIDLIATDAEAGTVGTIIYWRLRGPISSKMLSSVWGSLPESASLLPSATSPQRALRIAVDTVAGKRLLVRPNPKGGWALVSETVTEDQALSHLVLLTVQITDGELEFHIHPAGEPFKAHVKDAYAVALGRLSASDFSAWLTHKVLIGELQATALRPNGGIYYLPAFSVARWEAIREALGDVSSHEVFEIPAMRTDSAVEAILESLNEEATASMDQMFADLEGELGKRALKTRAARCEAVQKKVAGYAKMLGVSLDELSARSTELRRAITVATLTEL